jgi:hypothetical protein
MLDSSFRGLRVTTGIRQHVLLVVVDRFGFRQGFRLVAGLHRLLGERER